MSFKPGFHRFSPAIQSSISVVLIRIAGIALQALTLILLTHVLPPAPLGIYATVYAATAIARLLGPLGFDQLALRGKLPGRGDVGVWDGAVLVLGLNAGLALLLALLARVVGAPLSLMHIVMAAALLPAFALAGLLAAQVRSSGGVIAAQWPESVQLPLMIAIGFVIGHVTGGLTLTGALTGLLVSAWSTTVTYMILVITRPGGEMTRPSVMRARLLTREGSAIFIALFFTAMSARAPMLLALPVLGPFGAAMMEVANRFGTLGTVVTSSVATTYSPIFARSAETGDQFALRSALRGGALFSGMTSLGLTILLAILFPFAAGSVLPNVYIASYPALIVLALATAINGGLGLASNLMFMRGEARVVRAASLVQTIVVYIAAIPLGLRFGCAGVAVACLAGTLLRDGWLFWRVSAELR